MLENPKELLYMISSVLTILAVIAQTAYIVITNWTRWKRKIINSTIVLSAALFLSINCIFFITTSIRLNNLEKTDLSEVETINANLLNSTEIARIFEEFEIILEEHGLTQADIESMTLEEFAQVISDSRFDRTQDYINWWLLQVPPDGPGVTGYSMDDRASRIRH